MIREDNSEGRFRITDKTIYPPKEKAYPGQDFAGFLHSIKHEFNVEFEKDNNFIPARDYQKQACMHYLDTSEFKNKNIMEYNNNKYPEFISKGYQFSLVAE